MNAYVVKIHKIKATGMISGEVSFGNMVFVKRGRTDVVVLNKLAAEIMENCKIKYGFVLRIEKDRVYRVKKPTTNDTV